MFFAPALDRSFLGDLVILSSEQRRKCEKSPKMLGLPAERRAGEPGNQRILTC
jgi:hypothetical protein